MATKAVTSGASRTASAKSTASWISRLPVFLKALGPGIVTGAADDDPSGIATYSQVGAQFGFAMLWTMVLTYPLMAAIQEISAWIGRVTGIGLAGNIRRHYSPLILYPLVALLLIANVINLGADIGAMGSALELVVGGPALLYTVAFGVISVIAAIAFPYKQYAELLKWSALVLFVYAATAFVVHVPLKPVLIGTFVPSLSLSNSYLTALTAVFGTTISPYLFFWQASQEVQEQQAARGEKALKRAPRQAPAQLRRMRGDTYLGMAFSNVIAFFIMLDTAAVLHTHGITDIQTGAQAAEALRPLAGELAFLLFSIGIIGTGLIAVPVLAGSSAYALAEALKWPIGLERKLHRAKGFYGILAVATLIGVALNFTDINPIKALFWSAVINGVAAVPIMIVMMLMTSNKSITGGLRLPTPQKAIGWIATGVMFAVAACMLASLI
ncbi:MAG: divalent metal cation transporter [Candidatus Binatus sp.]|jgi:NRAMP (natural resistance-associated macrophage protein)-like metal ion transporter|uniref:NRAMP family divalent metal transporter n=1 Tax=Candidatus Binatus sp. TaxID=2811406 RepID=UPI003C72AFCD